MHYCNFYTNQTYGSLEYYTPEKVQKRYILMFEHICPSFFIIWTYVNVFLYLTPQTKNSFIKWSHDKACFHMAKPKATQCNMIDGPLNITYRVSCTLLNV